MTRPMMKPGFAVEQAVAEGRTRDEGEDAAGKFHHYAAACPLCLIGGLKVYFDAAVSCTGCGSTDAAAMLARVSGGVAVASTEISGTTTPLPFTGRRPASDFIRQVDMADVLSRPEEPIRWTIEDFAQRGALTVLAARGGTGKSWVGIEACASVQAGRPFAGLDVEQGPAVYVDGEMGARQMAGRFRAGGIGADAFTVLDVTGLDLGAEDGCAALEHRLSSLGASFVVIDSLRRLTPGKRESDSDDMAPVLGRLAVMAKTLDLAIVLVHHAGWSEDRAWRGSTAIGDQADAVFALERPSTEAPYLRLFCDPSKGCKMRGAAEPEDRWMRLAIGEQDGVVVVASSSLAAATTHPGKAQTAAERMHAQLVELFDGITRPVRKGDAAAGVRVDPQNQNFRAAWRQLVAEGAIVETADGFMRAEDVAHATVGAEGGAA